MASLRRTEIHARRTRKKKLNQLKVRYAEAGGASEKELVLQKLARVIPWMSQDEFKKLVKA